MFGASSDLQPKHTATDVNLADIDRSRQLIDPGIFTVRRRLGSESINAIEENVSGFFQPPTKQMPYSTNRYPSFYIAALLRRRKYKRSLRRGKHVSLAHIALSPKNHVQLRESRRNDRPRRLVDIGFSHGGEGATMEV